MFVAESLVTSFFPLETPMFLHTGKTEELSVLRNTCLTKLLVKLISLLSQHLCSGMIFSGEFSTQAKSGLPPLAFQKGRKLTLVNIQSNIQMMYYRILQLKPM